MLKRLYIKNFALIDELDIELYKGFSVITGETGAGKSIILGAIGLLLGQRADSKTLKQGAERCVIEAHFDLSRYDMQAFFTDNDIDYDGEDTIIRRELTAAGKSRAFINDTPVALSMLKELGEQLVDIHSQHQNLLLNKQDFQLSVVDILAQDAQQLERYQQTYTDYQQRQRELAAMKDSIERNRQQQDFLQFQYEELTAAQLKEGELEELEQQSETMSHAEDIKTALYEADHALTAEQTGAVGQVRSVLHALSGISKVLPQATELAERLDSCHIELKDISDEVSRLLERTDFDPAELDNINNRLDRLYDLQKKYHAETIGELISQRDTLQQQLQNIENSDEAVSELEAQCQQLQAQCQQQADALTKLRQKAAKEIVKQMQQRLVPLGMPNVRFDVSITPTALGKSGQDAVNFLFSANTSTPLQPVAQVASGGEIARVMLSLKAMISGAVKLPTIIFDEIDTGVSGKIAEKMAEIMQEMGSYERQVISITHLPQIAALGSHHYRVTKEETPQGTTSHMQELTADERVTEIAQMLSGSDVTAAAVQNAKALLKQKVLTVLLLLMTVLNISAAEPPFTGTQLAFPGADGYGKYTSGGRGGEVCYVTSLDDCTDANLVEGTLRWAIRHDNGGKPRTILFKVGGTIRLTSKLKFLHDNVSILGQTAPGGGICIAGYDIYLCNDNIILRYIRFRAGEMAAASITSLDMENAKHVIIDHCSLTWSMEECLTAYDSDYTTIQWSIIGEGLYNSLNPKGVRSYATQWGGEHSTMHHCLITNCNNRTVRFNGVRSESKIGQGRHDHDAQVLSEYANNVVFNWGKPNSAYGGENDKTVNNSADGSEHLGYDRVYMINNYYRPGPVTQQHVSGTRYFAQGDYDQADGYGQWYLSGNKFELDSKWKGAGTEWSTDCLQRVNADNLYGFTTADTLRAFNLKDLSAANAQELYDRYIMNALPAGGLSGMQYESADDAFHAVCQGAGASLPRYDAVDARLLKEAHGDIDPQYTGVAKPKFKDGIMEQPRGKGIINSPNDIAIEAYGGKHIQFDFTYRRPGSKQSVSDHNIYPDLSGISTAVDSDGDGMPDVYEDAHGFNKHLAADGAFIAANGYSNLENFLNAVVAGTVTAEGETTP